NSMKHSSATEVIIRLALKDKSFELVVEDNGKGFTFGEAAKNVSSADHRVASGNGLENMKRRLVATGGSFEILSRPGEGTKVVFRVPFNA
ncbi:MAG TPA: ATP-binding protein, partial [Candidatus Paceibacterota bacterium]|nr:ATP-binding protein [Candidatus Paceibacterota bacterium]